MNHLIKKSGRKYPFIQQIKKIVNSKQTTKSLIIKNMELSEKHFQNLT